MSASMYWRPATPRLEGEYVDDAVRYKLAQRLWHQDGSLSTEPDVIGKDQLSYLEGLRDAGVEGAQDLIDAIRKHGSIEIWIQR